MPSSTPSSICSALAANGGSFQATSRLGRPCTGTTGTGVRVLLHRALYPLARLAAGRKPEPTLAIMDGQSVKTTERGGVRGLDGHKRVKGRKRHILVDILGLPITNRVEPANLSDCQAGGRMLAGLAPLWPTIRTIIADPGHESRKLLVSCGATAGTCRSSSANSDHSRSQVSPGLLSAASHGSRSIAASRRIMNAMSRHQKRC